LKVTPGIHVITTDFGEVVLSQESIGYLESISPDWQKLAYRGPFKRKSLERKRAQVQDFIKAVSVMSRVRWVAGGVLRSL
jgi:hypothetical protein